MLKVLFVALQYILPQHALSRLAGLLANRRIPVMTPLLIRLFARFFRVDMAQARYEKLSDYTTFNAFFTRALKPEARPFLQASHWAPERLISPVDGRVSQAGVIHNSLIFQAKGHSFSLRDLVGPDIPVAPYAEGAFATLYLSPRDYHRVHMPSAGHLVRMTFIPGRLFSVNQTTVTRVDGLFARNERLVCEFETPTGPLLIVLIGAMIVGSISTSWSGVLWHQRRVQTWHYDPGAAPRLARGEEMGRFQLGSTVILITPGRTDDWASGLQPGQTVQAGQPV